MTSLSKSQQAYEWISHKIRSREFEPEDRLVLSTIAEEINCSVVPVREAIRQLEAEGLVTFERNVGAKVTSHNRNAYFETMEIVASLEATATALSSPVLSPTDIEQARKINDELKKVDVAHAPEEFTRLNKDFHRILFEKCPNKRLVDLVYEQWEKLAYHRVSTFTFIPGRAAASIKEHEKILGLIELEADFDYLAKVAREHRLRTSEAYRKQIENQKEAKNNDPP